MDLTFSDADTAFREEVRAFFRDQLPEELRRKGELGVAFTKDDHVSWQKKLYEKGWIAPNWPKEYGGTGWTPVQKYIFDEEYGASFAPRIIPFGISMIGPVLIAFGNDAQKQAYLPRILSSDDWWCQGYSEPGAGSDLASLQTRAVPDGDAYVVNGQKIWTTLAQHADMMFCLVRTGTDGKKQEGISFLVFPMTTPGITVDPIVTMDGLHHVNQVFLEDVRVPKENLIGEEGQGWTIAKFLLGHERTGIAGIGASKGQLGRLKRIAAAQKCNGRPLIEDPDFRRKVAEVEIDLLALEYTNLQILAAESAGHAPGPESSLLKVKGTLIQQRLAELLREAVGNRAHPYSAEAMKAGWGNDAPLGPDYAAFLAPHYFGWRKSSIYGGSNEIQRGIIAKQVLGL